MFDHRSNCQVCPSGWKLVNRYQTWLKSQWYRKSTLFVPSISIYMLLSFTTLHYFHKGESIKGARWQQGNTQGHMLYTNGNNCAFPDCKFWCVKWYTLSVNDMAVILLDRHISSPHMIVFRPKFRLGNFWIHGILTNKYWRLFIIQFQGDKPVPNIFSEFCGIEIPDLFNVKCFVWFNWYQSQNHLQYWPKNVLWQLKMVKNNKNKLV